MASVSRRRAWLMAARPQTLPIGAAPVVAGTGLALADGRFAVAPALAALVGALLIQIGANLANDYYDAVKGADSADREGFTRVTAGGLIPPERVRRATWLVLAAAVAVGTYLVAVGGVPVLAVGVASVVCAVAYTGGPYPLGYHGLGDPFVLLFFGPVAVAGTYYVQAAAAVAGVPILPPPGTVPLDAVVAGVGPGSLATAVLVVNNLRDVDADREAGKRTLAVRFGRRGARVEFLLLCKAAFVVPVYLWLVGYGADALLPLLALLPTAFVAATVLTETGGDALNPALERTGQMLGAYALLLAVGIAA